MLYRIEFKSDALDDLRRLDQAVARRVMTRLKWLSGNFDALTPEALAGEFKGLFKLMVGSYRAIYSVDQGKHLVTIHFVGHRSEVYKGK